MTEGVSIDSSSILRHMLQDNGRGKIARRFVVVSLVVTGDLYLVSRIQIRRTMPQTPNQCFAVTSKS